MNYRYDRYLGVLLSKARYMLPVYIHWNLNFLLICFAEVG